MTDDLLSTLSEREREILRQLATGAGNKEIAAQLYISPNTVKVHLRNIFGKIGVASRTEAAMFAVRAGLVQVFPPTLPDEAAPEPPPPPVEPAEPAARVAPVEMEPAAPVVGTPPATAPARRANPVLWIVGAVAALGLIFALGWLWGQNTPANPTPNAVLSVQPSPAPTLSPWQSYPPMPLARSQLAAVGYARRIYAIGGQTATGLTGQTARFDPALQTWETLADKPVPVAEAQAAVLGGRLYVPGGRTEGGISRVVEVFDPETNQWERRADLPAPRSAYGLVAFEGELLLIGGWDGTAYVAEVLAYDPQNDTWRVAGALPAARGRLGATIASGEIYVAGGTNGERVFTETLVLQWSNPLTWEARAPLPVPQFNLALVSVGEVVYAVGGQSAPNEAGGLWRYTPPQNQWLDVSPQIALPRYSGLVAGGSEVWFLGGEQGQLLADMLAYRVLYTLFIPVIQ